MNEQVIVQHTPGRAAIIRMENDAYDFMKKTGYVAGDDVQFKTVIKTVYVPDKKYLDRVRTEFEYRLRCAGFRNDRYELMSLRHQMRHARQYAPRVAKKVIEFRQIKPVLPPVDTDERLEARELDEQRRANRSTTSSESRRRSRTERSIRRLYAMGYDVDDVCDHLNGRDEMLRNAEPKTTAAHKLLHGRKPRRFNRDESHRFAA